MSNYNKKYQFDNSKYLWLSDKRLQMPRNNLYSLTLSMSDKQDMRAYYLHYFHTLYVYSWSLAKHSVNLVAYHWTKILNIEERKKTVAKAPCIVVCATRTARSYDETVLYNRCKTSWKAAWKNNDTVGLWESLQDDKYHVSKDESNKIIYKLYLVILVYYH